MCTFQKLFFPTLITLSILLSTSAFEYKSDISEEESFALKIFREFLDDVELLDYQKEDNYLIQFLRAKKYHMFEAVDMLKEAQEWRLVNNIDSIQNETLDIIPGYVVSLITIDIEGHPIVTLSLGNVKIQKLLLTDKKEKFLRLNYQILERMAARARLISEVTQEDIHQIYTIVDFHGYSLKQHGCAKCIQTLKTLHSNILKYYPGLRFREVWINTPRIADPLVKSLRTLYAEANNSGVLKIFGSDRKEWSNYILKSIPDDQITFQFGGTRAVSDFLTAI